MYRNTKVPFRYRSLFSGEELMAQQRLRHQMSSGLGTQHNDSRDEPTYGESMELRAFYAANSTDTAPETPLIQKTDSTDDQDIEVYLQYQKSLLNRSPSYRQSIDRISLLSSHTEQLPPEYNTTTVQHQQQKLSTHLTTPRPERKELSPVTAAHIGHRHSSSIGSATQIGRYHRELPRLPSSQSVNTLSNDQDELLQTSNLRDELLNCDQKELFQFLSDDFDTSNNYFSDTVGFGSAFIDSETDSLVFDSKKETPPRKTSSSSMKSNFSYISNSIFTTLEQKRGGSISESIDRMLTRSESMQKICASTDSGAEDDDREPLVNDSEFENIIVSFERELNEIKKSTPSLNRGLSVNSRTSNGSGGVGGRSEKHSRASISQHVQSPQSLSSPPHVVQQQQTQSSPQQQQNIVLPRRTIVGPIHSNSTNRESVKIKRRSLEKQNKVDDGFSVSNEIRKICDHFHAPFTDVNSLIATNTVTATTALTTKSNTTSPNLRRKTDFHSSFDRIKRTSLIERVDESVEDPTHPHHQFERPTTLSPAHRPTQIVSEKLPRKHLAADYTLDSISLKSTGSYENLITHRAEHQKQLKAQLSDDRKAADDKSDLDSTLKSKQAKQAASKSPAKSDDGKCWFECVCYECVFLIFKYIKCLLNVKKKN